MEILYEYLAFAGPTAAGLITVPVLDALKAVSNLVDRTPAPVKQILAVTIAFGLTKLGSLLSIALPGDLALFTGSDIEGLVSAGIAMAAYAGRKASSEAPRLLLVALAAGALTLPADVSAQTDSATVTVIDRTDLNVMIDPPGPVRRFRGDSVQFSATAVDTVSGDTLEVEFFWSSSNSNVLSVDPETGMAHFLSRGNAQLVVEVVRLVGLIATVEQEDGTWTEVYTNGAREAHYAATGVVPPQNEVILNTWQRMCWYAFDSRGRVEPAGQDGPVEYGINVIEADGDVWDHVDDGGPQLVVTAHADSVSMVAPEITGCPAWSEILPTMPVPQQLLNPQTLLG